MLVHTTKPKSKATLSTRLLQTKQEINICSRSRKIFQKNISQINKTKLSLTIFLRNRHLLTNFVVSDIIFASVLKTAILTLEGPGFRTNYEDQEPSIEIRICLKAFLVYI